MTSGANLHTVSRMNVGNRQFREYINAVKTITGLSPTAIAAKAGLSPSTINTPYYRPELGVTPTLRTINKIANATDVPFDPKSFEDFQDQEDSANIKEKTSPNKKYIITDEKLSIEDFQDYLRTVISRTGFSPTMIAKISGVSGPTITNAYYNGSIPTRRTVERIAQAVGIPFSDPAKEAPESQGIQPPEQSGVLRPVSCQPMPVPFDFSSLRKDLPVIFLHTIKKPSNNKLEGYNMQKDITEFCRRPPGVEGALNAYATYAPDDALVKYDTGDLLVIVPGRPVKVGDCVLVHVRYKIDEEPVIHLGRLMARSPTSITLATDRPEPTQQKIPAEKLVSIHKVLNNRELFGL